MMGTTSSGTLIVLFGIYVFYIRTIFTSTNLTEQRIVGAFSHLAATPALADLFAGSALVQPIAKREESQPHARRVTVSFEFDTMREEC